MTLELPLTMLVIMTFIMARRFHRGKKSRRGKGISILIPFRESAQAVERAENVQWLQRYWKAHLPMAEIIIGHDCQTHLPFSKSVAINEAASRATGDILVLADADCYILTDYVLYCAKEIRHARKLGRRLWFVPYRQFYRLSESARTRLLNSDPVNPVTFPEKLAPEDIIHDTNPLAGHWYGAMIHILPREAFDIVGGWDERFRGWGGEDHAAMRATDTLYWPHKTLPSKVFHVWHPMIGADGIKRSVHWKDRRWEGQADPTINNKLSWRYYHAFGKFEIMRRLVDEWKKLKHKDTCHPKPPKPCPPLSF
jgi:predicted glycosyltransferase involved in capsule biosynthesis